ncbi:MAG: site-specific integrase, partial [Synechococcus sp. cluster2_bin.44]|nr:site-specific integrase [Synechococcus sp. cluster2_bin.44]
MFLAETEQLIKEARGQQLTPTQQLLSLIPQREEIPAGVDAHELVSGVSREPMYLDNQGSINPKYEELHDLAQGVLKGTAKDLKTPEDLLTRATLLKSPAPGTRFEWERYLGKLMEKTGKQYLQQITRDDALSWR